MANGMVGKKTGTFCTRVFSKIIFRHQILHNFKAVNSFHRPSEMLFEGKIFVKVASGISFLLIPALHYYLQSHNTMFFFSPESLLC